MKRYIIQYNEFVFQRAVEDDSSTAFKDDIIEYTYKHGGYSPLRGLVKTGKVSITVKLLLDELPCEERPFYRDFVMGQLSKAGKLWAIQNGTLLWTNASLANVAPAGNDEIDIEFNLLEGVWHKADLQKTFLRPWDVCSFMDCYEFKEVQPCRTHEEDCCKCGENHPLGCDCCECQGLSKEMALCYNLDKIKEFNHCEPNFQAVYSCDGAERYFDELGEKICGNCGLITGNFYSNTDIDTNIVTIRFKGEVNDPYIEINGNANQIKGSYKDLEIYPDGTLKHGCMDCEIDVANWIVPEGNEYGWTIHQGNNRVLIENCCGAVCVWISADALTI